MLTTTLLVLAILQVSRCVLSLPSDDRRLRGQLSSLPAGYALHDTAPHPDHELRLTIAMPQANESDLYMALLDVSDPNSTNYGRHLSTAEVRPTSICLLRYGISSCLQVWEYTAPRPESLQIVTKWLHTNGLAFSTATDSGDMLHIRLSLERANALLDANFMTYIHEPTNTTTIRTLSYALPVHLHGHITLVYPTAQ